MQQRGAYIWEGGGGGGGGGVKADVLFCFQVDGCITGGAYTLEGL